VRACFAYNEGTIMKENSQLSIDRLLAQVEANKRQFASMTMGNDPQVAFLPEGEHLIRFFPDSDGELLRSIGIHRRGRFRTHCPKYLGQYDPAADYPVCEICPLAVRRNDWQLRMQQLTLCYGYVCQTSHESRFWQPGRTYVVVGNPQMHTAFCSMVESLATSDPQTLTSMLTPQVPGPGTLVRMQKGLRGFVTVEPLTDKQLPPITLGSWYRPLQDCWLGPNFDITHYTALLLQLQTE
jgi:hypothetical protein